MINDICYHIIHKINKYNPSYLHNKEVKQLCIKDNITNCKLSLRNKDANNVYTFNSRQEPISLTTLHTFDKIICLFQLQRLVLKGEKAFWQSNLIQIKKCSNTIQPSFAQCLIVHNDNYNLTDTNTKYNSYNKMLQLQIPIEAIKHKMLMDGLTEVDYNEWQNGRTSNNKVITSPAPPPPPPPPPPLHNLFNNKCVSPSTKIKSSSDTNPFLKDIASGSFKLKKINEEDTKHKILKNLTNDKFAPPSLNDIKGALLKLKRININHEQS
jgi:hypothetical protein